MLPLPHTFSVTLPHHILLVSRFFSGLWSECCHGDPYANSSWLFLLFICFFLIGGGGGTNPPCWFHQTFWAVAERRLFSQEGRDQSSHRCRDCVAASVFSWKVGHVFPPTLDMHALYILYVTHETHCRKSITNHTPLQTCTRAERYIYTNITCNICVIYVFPLGHFI